MITKLTLENFKSFGKKVEIDFKDLEILAGSNSSGKSTIIQSLLLLKQSISGKNDSAPLNIDGEYFSVGSFSDLVYEGPGKKNTGFSIGFELDVPIFTIDNFYLTSEEFEFDRELFLEQDITCTATVKTTFDYKINTKNQIELSKLSYRVSHPELGEIDFVGNNQGDYFDISVEMSPLPMIKDSFDLPGSIKEQKDNSNLTDFLYEGESVEKLGLWQANNFNELIASKYGLNIYALKPYTKHFNKIITRLSTLRNAEEKAANHFFWISMEDLLRAHFYLEASFSVKGKLIFSQFDISLQKWKPNETDQIERGKYISFYAQIEGIIEKFIMPVSVQLNTFMESIEYLGPLRAKPERAYLALGSKIEIGQRGENSIPFLWQHQDKLTTTKYSISRSEITKPLLEVTRGWLKIFGLSESFTVSKPASLVFQTEIETFAGAKKNITIADIGFGVSQILPIILLVLNSDAGKTIILEQPEIHLHPKMQGILADFLICHALLGKRFLVETHSEHLIDTLRLRIAQDKTNSLGEMIGIQFVRKGKMMVKGKGKSPNRYVPTSVVESLSINEQGRIVNWPKDFFPESIDISRLILQANLDKK